MTFLSPEEWARYQRQIMLPEVGEEGQRKIKSAKVFLSGLGGLGSVSAYYMAAAGVGHLRVVDRDRVELGNLNRQILYGCGDIGRPKTDTAMERLHGLNPECSVEAIHEEIREDNASDLIGDCSVIVDGMDNLKARITLNEASLQKGIPLIFGGVEGIDGMVTTFVPGETPCLECLFPGKVSGQKTVGVLGPLPGLVASIQALETLKYLLGMEGLLKCRLLSIRGSDMTIKTIRIERNPHCRVCG